MEWMCKKRHNLVLSWYQRTFNRGKSFEITYIRLKFYSPRPESFAIYKRTCQDCPWIPYQYYSGSCRSTYNLPDSEYVSYADETLALCTSEFSDISPLTGGNIAFSTLENRPSARSFDNSAVLQDWVTATDILVMLTRLNTFGDEVFRVPNVLRSYFLLSQISQLVEGVNAMVTPAGASKHPTIPTTVLCVSVNITQQVQTVVNVSLFTMTGSGGEQPLGTQINA
nr:laminin subunit gamma-1-like [Lytechinus pictus]